MKSKEDIKTHLSALGKKDVEAKRYIDETITCLDAECYRAATILAWSVFMFFLYKKITENGLTPFMNEAKEMKIKLPKVNNFYDLNKVQDIDVIRIAHRMGIFDQNVQKQLKQLLERRNNCAHVGQPDPQYLSTLSLLGELVQYTQIVIESKYESGAKPLLKVLSEKTKTDRITKITQLGWEQIQAIAMQIFRDLNVINSKSEYRNNKILHVILDDIVANRTNDEESQLLVNLTVEQLRTKTFYDEIENDLHLILRHLCQQNITTKQHFAEIGGIDWLLDQLRESHDFPRAVSIINALRELVPLFNQPQIKRFVNIVEENAQVAKAYTVTYLARDLASKHSGQIPEELLAQLKNLSG